MRELHALPLSTFVERGIWRTPHNAGRGPERARHRARERRQHLRAKPPVVAEQDAQPPRERADPLSSGHLGEHVVDEVRGRVRQPDRLELNIAAFRAQRTVLWSELSDLEDLKNGHVRLESPAGPIDLPLTALEKSDAAKLRQSILESKARMRTGV